MNPEQHEQQLLYSILFSFAQEDILRGLNAEQASACLSDAIDAQADAMRQAIPKVVFDFFLHENVVQ